MSGNDYSQQANYIYRQFDDLTTSTKEGWKDDQATKFEYNYIEPVRKALSDMQISIEYVVNVLDSKLNEIRGIASSR